MERKGNLNFLILLCIVCNDISNILVSFLSTRETDRMAFSLYSFVHIFFNYLLTLLKYNTYVQMRGSWRRATMVYILCYCSCFGLWILLKRNVYHRRVRLTKYRVFHVVYLVHLLCILFEAIANSRLWFGTLNLNLNTNIIINKVIQMFPNFNSFLPEV